MKNELKDNVNELLIKHDYKVIAINGCFDILARKQDTILLIKVLNDANSLLKQHIEEMKNIAVYFNAVPLIITNKAGYKLQDNVVYKRFDINTINFSTVNKLINNNPVFAKTVKNCVTVTIDSNKFRSSVYNQDISKNALSKKLNLSIKTINKCEYNDAELTLNNALKLHEVLGEVFKPVNIFINQNQIINVSSYDISYKYNELGFKTLETEKTPFNLIAKKQEEVIITNVGDKLKRDFEFIGNLLDLDSLVIFKEKKPKDIAAVKKEEFLDFEEANELIKFVKAF